MGTGTLELIAVRTAVNTLTSPGFMGALQGCRLRGCPDHT